PVKYEKKARRSAPTALTLHPFDASTTVLPRFTSRSDAVHEKCAIIRRAHRFDRPEISSRVGEGTLVRDAPCRISRRRTTGALVAGRHGATPSSAALTA